MEDWDYLGNLINRVAFLRQPGLTLELLREAIAVGFRAASETTVHHPSSMAGYLAWGETIKFLRDELIPCEWTCVDVDNVPGVLSPDGHIRIIAASGTAPTGSLDAAPRFVKPKGSATAGMIRNNATEIQTVLPGIPPLPEEPLHRS